MYFFDNEKNLTKFFLEDIIIASKKNQRVRKMKFVNSVQKWLPFDKFFNNGIIKLKNNSYIKIIKIIPINFNLKSELEKDAILNSYKIFLKTFNSNIQILIQSSKENLSKHISQIKEKNLNQKNENILKLSNNYIQFIEYFNQQKKSSTKVFYVLLKKSPENLNKEIKEVEEKNIINSLNDEYFVLKECIMRCGNRVIEIENKEEIKSIIKSFLGRNQK